MSPGFNPVTRVTIRNQRKRVLPFEGEVIPVKWRGEQIMLLGSTALQLVHWSRTEVVGLYSLICC